MAEGIPIGALQSIHSYTLDLWCRKIGAAIETFTFEKNLLFALCNKLTNLIFTITFNAMLYKLQKTNFHFNWIT